MSAPGDAYSKHIGKLLHFTLASFLACLCVLYHSTTRVCVCLNCFSVSLINQRILTRVLTMYMWMTIVALYKLRKPLYATKRKDDKKPIKKP